MVWFQQNLKTVVAKIGDDCNKNTNWFQLCSLQLQHRRWSWSPRRVVVTTTMGWLLLVAASPWMVAASRTEVATIPWRRRGSGAKRMQLRAPPGCSPSRHTLVVVVAKTVGWLQPFVLPVAPRRGSTVGAVAKQFAGFSFLFCRFQLLAQPIAVPELAGSSGRWVVAARRLARGGQRRWS